jgi:hypothetical protein
VMCGERGGVSPIIGEGWCGAVWCTACTVSCTVTTGGVFCCSYTGGRTMGETETVITSVMLVVPLSPV